MPDLTELAPNYFRLSKTLDTAADESDQTLKSSAGQVVEIDVANTHATEWLYLKLYDAASVTVSSAVPTYSFALPPATARHIEFLRPLSFAVAIHYAAAQERGAGATAPTTAPSVHFRYL